MIFAGVVQLAERDVANVEVGGSLPPTRSISDVQAWVRSSDGRAIVLQAIGRRFDPDRIHQVARGGSSNLPPALYNGRVQSSGRTPGAIVAVAESGFRRSPVKRSTRVRIPSVTPIKEEKENVARGCDAVQSLPQSIGGCVGLPARRRCSRSSENRAFRS